MEVQFCQWLDRKNGQKQGNIIKNKEIISSITGYHGLKTFMNPLFGLYDLWSP